MNDKTRGRLGVQVFVDCPRCEWLINLLDDTDTSGEDLDEGGHIMRQAFPDGSWHDAHEKFEVEDVKCSSCGHVFDVCGLEW